MTIEKIIFLVIAAISLGAALMVVTARKLIHSALWLILTLFGVAVVYGLLDAGFLAAAQVVIYIGAIAILFIFAVMLTRRVMQDTGSQNNQYWWVAAPLIGVVIWRSGLDDEQLARVLDGAAQVSPGGQVRYVETAGPIVSIPGWLRAAV